MKRLIAWVAGAAGGLAAYRALRHKPPLVDAGADARAAELKLKLQEARTVADDRDAFDSGEVTVDQAEALDPQVLDPQVLDPQVLDPQVLDPQVRRAQVHEQGRAALDEMRGDQS